MSLNSQSGFDTGTDYTKVPADRHRRELAIVFVSISGSLVTLVLALADLFPFGDFTKAVKYIACLVAVLNIVVVALSLTYKDKLATVLDEARSPIQ